jgi:hypothetical protein
MQQEDQNFRAETQEVRNGSVDGGGRQSGNVIMNLYYYEIRWISRTWTDLTILIILFILFKLFFSQLRTAISTREAETQELRRRLKTLYEEYQSVEKTLQHAKQRHWAFEKQRRERAVKQERMGGMGGSVMGTSFGMSGFDSVDGSLMGS